MLLTEAAGGPGISSVHHNLLAGEVVVTGCSCCTACCSPGVGIVRLLAALISPYMPSLTDKILQQVSSKFETLFWEERSWGLGPVAEHPQPC
jgi:hypothetical protein